MMSITCFMISSSKLHSYFGILIYFSTCTSLKIIEGALEINIVVAIVIVRLLMTKPGTVVTSRLVYPEHDFQPLGYFK